MAGCVSPEPVPTGWFACDTGRTASLRAIAALDHDVAFVGGSDGTLLRTRDGGQSWQDVAPGDAGDCDFRDLHAFDAERVVAMVAGQPARVYRTKDAGGSWTVVHADARPAAFFDALAFAGTRGVLFGDAMDGAFTCLMTGDAGESWRPAPDGTLPPPFEGEAGFAASGTCVVPDAKHGGFHLVTGGGPSRHVRFGPEMSPVVVPLPLATGASSAGAFSVAVRGSSLVVVGGDYRLPARRDGTAAYSRDGGRTWALADAGGYRSAVVWFGGDDAEQVLAVGSHGAAVSRDGGCSWQPFGTGVGFHALSVAADGSVWACGSDGRVARLIVAE